MLLSRLKVVELVERYRKQMPCVVGFTSGTFDLLHGGHVAYLREAKKLCDYLIVGVNSDASVKSYKNPNRPIIGQDHRVSLISELRCVDFAFLFEETNNHENINLLKPDLYIKAGDYDLSKLTSLPLVEAYGGKAVLIPVEEDISTTKIIERINPANATCIELLKEPTKVIFLDRDGVINEDIEYLHEPEKLVIKPNAIEGMKKMQAMGFRLVVVTNQAGIGLGYFSKEQFYRFNRELFKRLDGVTLDKIYFCPHGIDDKCECRKPCDGMLRQAAKDLNIDKSKSFMIGDKDSDIEAGRLFGCRTIRIGDGQSTTDYVAADLLEAANWIEQ